MSWLVLSALAQPAWAAEPVTAPERWVAVKTASARAESLLYPLARVALPLCGERAAWGFGPPPQPLAPQPLPLASAEALRQQLMGRYGAQPGERVFVTVPADTPWARAGLLAGDRLLNPAGFDALPLPAGAASAAAPALQLRAAAQRDFEAQPQRQAQVQRGPAGPVLQLAVTAERSCHWAFSGLDSRWAYAKSEPGEVKLTLPLLADLGDADLTMALAHEAAHLLLGSDDGSRTGGQLAARLVFGKLAEIGENSELKIGPPEPKALLQADRLALWLLGALGVAPSQYLGFVQRMDQREVGLGEPSYARTRPLTPARLAALQAAVDGHQANGKLPLPAGVDRTALGSLRRAAGGAVLAASAPAAVATATPRPPRQHLWQAPAASGFAQADDLASVPLRDEGRARYAHYLTLPSPKAFFIVGTGGWRFHADAPDALQQGFEHCASRKLSCALYAVDHSVVWQADPARRITSLSPLQPAPPPADSGSGQ